MTKGREHAAASLASVIYIIRRQCQSGLLSIERMQHGRLEEGEIYFQEGQPVYAQAGGMRGQEALTWLMNWKHVNFAFLMDEVRHPTDISSSMDDSTTFVAIDTPAVPVYTFVPSHTDPLPRMRANSLVEYVPQKIDETPGIPGLEWLVPQKLGRERDVMALPLTRPQRSIYLLIDGQRTIADLARCMRKSIQEIERLLSELQARGLISV